MGSLREETARCVEKFNDGLMCRIGNVANECIVVVLNRYPIAV